MVPYTLSDLNQMGQSAFTAALGDVFEHTPAIAAQTWLQRPFDSVEELHRAMVTVMRSLSDDQHLALIRAHPDLATRTKMTASSVEEQSSLGLDQLSPAEYQTFQDLNQAYTDRFQFPFIVAVKAHTKASVLDAFRQRLTHDAATEKETALTEIAKIARFRLDDLLR